MASCVPRFPEVVKQVGHSRRCLRVRRVQGHRRPSSSPTLQLIAHEVHLEHIRAMHVQRLAAAEAATGAAGAHASGGSSVATVALPAHVTSQLAHAKQGTSAVLASAPVASDIARPTRSAPGNNFLLAAAAQQRGSEMTRNAALLQPASATVREGRKEEQWLLH